EKSPTLLQLTQLPPIHTVHSFALCLNSTNSKMRQMRQHWLDQSTSTFWTVRGVQIWIWTTGTNLILDCIATLSAHHIVVLDLQTLKSRKGEMQWKMGCQQGVAIQCRFKMELKDRM